jgi:hypothetical protein
MAEINRAMRRQRALITREQALEAGLTPGQIQARLRSRVWIELRPGVSALAGAPPSWEQMLQATLLSAGQGAWASHRSAARLWGVRGVGESSSFEVLTGLDRRVTLDGVVGRRSRELFDADLTTRFGIPCVAPPRALVDIAGSFRHDDLGKALDDLLRRKLRTLDDVRRCIGRLHAGPGRALKGIHGVLAERWPGYDPGESDLETRAVCAIARAGLPLPKQQHRMLLGGKKVRIDLAYPDLKIAIEVESWAFHGQIRSKFDCDHIRRDELILLRWTPFVFTSAMTDEYMANSTRTLLENAGAMIDGSTAA